MEISSYSVVVLVVMFHINRVVVDIDIVPCSTFDVRTKLTR